jgi:2-oxoglutarate dehydrogenase E2 component (dihydrolipoamide succinyltransferase)
LERESANDESATVVKLHALTGERIKAGSPVLDIETSKVVKEIQSPADGIIRHSLSIGDMIEFGACIFQVEPLDAPSSAPVAIPIDPARAVSPPSGRAEIPKVPPITQRVSPRARRMAEAVNLDLSLLPGRFITVEHVQRFMDGQSSSSVSSQLTPRSMIAPRAAPLTRPAAASDLALSPSKRREIENLQAGAGQSMLSVVGKELGSFKRAYADNPFFSDKIIDLVAYESSRLLRQTPRLNAGFHEDASITLHSQINAGVAIDDGKGLMVYSLKSADLRSLTELQSAILEGLEKYLAGEISSSDVSSATYTITDLSASGIDFVLPLLPRGQSMIIGITRGRARGFSLYVGFDHRVTEGREASQFLSSLCDRILSFGTRFEATAVACSVCGKTLQEEVGKFKERGLLRVVNEQGKDVLICHNCDAGW